MFKLIKWNSIDFVRNYYWLFIGMVVSLLLAVLAVNSQGDIRTTMILLATLLGMVVFPAGVVLAVSGCYRWLETDSKLLELSLPVSSWKTLLSKLVVSLVVNGLASLFLFQLFVFIGTYSTGSIELLNWDYLKGVPGLLLLLMVVDCTVLFSYLLTKGLRLKRGASVMVTCLLSLTILGSISMLMISLMTVAGALVLPAISNQSILTVNGTLNVLSTTIPVVIFLAIIVLEYLASEMLLTRRH